MNLCLKSSAKPSIGLFFVLWETKNIFSNFKIVYTQLFFLESLGCSSTSRNGQEHDSFFLPWEYVDVCVQCAMCTLCMCVRGAISAGTLSNWQTNEFISMETLSEWVSGRNVKSGASLHNKKVVKYKISEIDEKRVVPGKQNLPSLIERCLPFVEKNWTGIPSLGRVEYLVNAIFARFWTNQMIRQVKKNAAFRLVTCASSMAVKSAGIRWSKPFGCRTSFLYQPGFYYFCCQCDDETREETKVADFAKSTLRNNFICQELTKFFKIDNIFRLDSNGFIDRIGCLLETNMF